MTPVLYEKDGRIARITLNRLEQRLLFLIWHYYILYQFRYKSLQNHLRCCRIMWVNLIRPQSCGGFSVVLVLQ